MGCATLLTFVRASIVVRTVFAEMVNVSLAVPMSVAQRPLPALMAFVSQPAVDLLDVTMEKPVLITFVYPIPVRKRHVRMARFVSSG